MFQKLLQVAVLLTLLTGVALANPQLPPDCGLCGCPDPSCLGCHTYCTTTLARLRAARSATGAQVRSQPGNSAGPEMLMLASTLPIGLGLVLTALRRRLRKSA